MRHTLEQLAIAGFLSVAAVAHASPIVIGGTGGGGAPNILGNSALSSQNVYGAAALSGLAPNTLITSLAFRQSRNDAAGPVSPLSYADYTLTLSTSRNAPGSLSPVFADNLGSDAVIVRSGALLVPTGSFPGGSSPNAFGFELAFDVPYRYSGGPLLMTISHTTGIGTGVGLDAGVVTGATQNQIAFTANASEGIRSGTVVPIIALTTRALPEPSTAALVGLAGVGLLYGRRRNRQPRCDD